MKRKILIILVAIFLVLSVFSMIFLFKFESNQICTTKIYSEIESKDKGHLYKVDFKISNKNNDSGIIRMVGTLDDYSINRFIYYEMENKKESNVKFKITSTIKSSSDDISDEAFNRYFSVLSVDKISYVKVNKITEGRYLFSGLLGPYFVCEIQDTKELTIM